MPVYYAVGCGDARPEANRAKASGGAHCGGGQGRARFYRRRAGAARPALLPGRPAGNLRRRIRLAAAAHRGAGTALSKPRQRDKPHAEGRRAACREIRQGPPRRAHALARQRLHGRGSARFRWPRPPLLEARRRHAARCHRRDENRRPFGVAALRARRAGGCRHARRRQRGRGRYRQCAHHRRHSRAAEGPARARCLRGARRSLYVPRRFRRAQ